MTSIVRYYSFQIDPSSDQQKTPQGEPVAFKAVKQKNGHGLFCAVTVGVNVFLCRKSQARDRITGAKVGKSTNGGARSDVQFIEVKNIHLRQSPLKILLIFHSLGNIA
jgi:hypothetical protein